MENKFFYQSKKNRSSDYRIIKIKTTSNFYGSLKTIILFCIISVQIIFLICSYLYIAEWFNSYLIISAILAILSSCYVLSTERNSYSKTVWVMFLLICFPFAWVFYLLSEEKFIFKKFKKRYNKIIEKSPLKLDNNVLNLKLNNNVKQDCNYLYNTGNFLTYTNSKLNYFSSGTQLFDDILENLSKAKHFIFIEYFIISDGILLKRFLKILQQKASEGIDIRIIYDDMGCHGKLKFRTKKQIKKMGIKIVSFNRLVPIFSVAMNYRNHRKLVIIDGKIAYTGGANLADEYINEKRTYGYWKDCGIKMQGKCVDTFTTSFLRQWEFITKTNINYSLYLNKSINYKNNYAVTPFVDGLEYSHHIGHDMFLNVISNSQEKVYIMTPYLVPDDGILETLKNKALSGIDVRIIIPQIPDKKYVYTITLDNAKKLIPYGVKIYLMNDSFVHSKIILTDYSAIVGSINMDMRSFYQQFESAVYTNDEEIMKKVSNDFEKTFFNSSFITKEQLKKKNIFSRIKVGILRILSPLM